VTAVAVVEVAAADYAVGEQLLVLIRLTSDPLEAENVKLKITKIIKKIKLVFFNRNKKTL